MTDLTGHPASLQLNWRRREGNIATPQPAQQCPAAQHPAPSQPLSPPFKSRTNWVSFPASTAVQASSDWDPLVGLSRQYPSDAPVSSTAVAPGECLAASRVVSVQSDFQQCLATTRLLRALHSLYPSHHQDSRSHQPQLQAQPVPAHRRRGLCCHPYRLLPKRPMRP